MKTPISVMLAMRGPADHAARAEQRPRPPPRRGRRRRWRRRTTRRGGRRRPWCSTSHGREADLGAQRHHDAERDEPEARRASRPCAPPRRRAGPAACVRPGRARGEYGRGRRIERHAHCARTHPLDRRRCGRPPARRGRQRAADRLRARPAGARAEGVLRAATCCASASATSIRRASPRRRPRSSTRSSGSGRPSTASPAPWPAGCRRCARRWPSATTATPAACGREARDGADLEAPAGRAAGHRRDEGRLAADAAAPPVRAGAATGSTSSLPAAPGARRRDDAPRSSRAYQAGKRAAKAAKRAEAAAAAEA